MARVDAIYRYPVKGLTPERLPQVTLAKGRHAAVGPHLRGGERALRVSIPQSRNIFRRSGS